MSYVAVCNLCRRPIDDDVCFSLSGYTSAIRRVNAINTEYDVHLCSYGCYELWMKDVWEDTWRAYNESQR